MAQAHVLIVEDQTLISKSIESILKKHGFDVAAICKTGEEAIAHCERKVPDLILMDIKLSGKLDGIETAARISKHSTVPIIYITDYNDASTFRKAKSTAPVNFISKPFTEPDLVRAAELAIFNSNKSRTTGSTSDTDFVFLKTGIQTWSRLEYSDILFLEADRAYCNIVCTDKTHVVSINMSAVHEQIDNTVFMKVHRSYVVNLRKVREFSGSDIIMNGHTISVSDQHRTELINRLKVIH